jgi:hypothetical protein
LPKVRVFISYDLDHDNDLKIRLIDHGTREGSPFAISDWSIRELAADWRDKAAKRISHVDLVFVICGEHTDTATGVNNEIALARETCRPYFLLEGRYGRSKRPGTALATDTLYDWSSEARLASVAAGRPHSLADANGASGTSSS